MLDDLRARGVKFQSLTEAVDTATPTGRAMWQMIGVLAELERSLISKRTRAGVKAAQRRGVKFGQKAKLSPEQIDHARKLIDQGEARQYMADLLNVGRFDALPGACRLTGACRADRGDLESGGVERGGVDPSLAQLSAGLLAQPIREDGHKSWVRNLQ